MQLTNQQMQAALDYCEAKVQDGRVWVCLKFEDYLMLEYHYSYGHPDYREFGEQVQKFLNAEFLTIHGRVSTFTGDLDAEICIDPEGVIPHYNRAPLAKALRLRMIAWLREQYPVEK